jgi:hypothetical protein
MQDERKYREYALECRRLAEKMSSQDKDVMLKIAEAWDRQAEIAAQRLRS